MKIGVNPCNSWKRVLKCNHLMNGGSKTLEKEKMTYDEFIHKCERMTGTKNVSVSDDDFKVIEFVYTYYPAISEVQGKEQIALLYMTFGMTVINDMKPRALKARELECKIAKARAEYDNAMNEYNELKRG